MKALLLSTSDIEGGAARAAYRLHRGLQAVGVDSQMLVQAKYSDDSTVLGPLTKLVKGIAKLKPTLDGLPLQFWRNRDRTVYSIQWLPSTVSPRAVSLYSDIINLHWVCGGCLQIEAIAKLGKPLVWTLHDMWPFTGGCHYSQGCDRYTKSCGACPQLHSGKNWDLSRWVWQRKANAWKDLDLTIVTPSSWLAECARNSSMFRNLRVEIIPNGLDTQKYKPIDRQVARELLNLPQDKYLVLFGAMNATSDLRKGFHLLQPALKKLSNLEWQDKIELVVFGASKLKLEFELGFRVHWLGRLYDDVSLAIVYSAADVMLVPSTQEAFGQTASESLACGTPVVTFNATGVKDIVEHQQNGYLAQPFEVDDLAQGIAWVLEDRERHQKLCDRAREKVEQEFTQELQAERYLSLYKELVDCA